MAFRTMRRRRYQRLPAVVRSRAAVAELLLEDRGGVARRTESRPSTEIEERDAGMDARHGAAAAVLSGIGVALAVGLVAPSAADTPASFAASRNYAVGAHPVSVAIGDLNGDGRPDLVSTNADANTVSVLLSTNRGG